MIDFHYDPDDDTFTGVTQIGTYLAEPTGRREHRETDHPHKNTMVYRLSFRPAGTLDIEDLGEGREGIVAMSAVGHYLTRTSHPAPRPGD